jgi:hypothetical protein
MPPPCATLHQSPSRWTISGELILVGDPPAPIMLAGFYTCCNDFYYAAQTIRTCRPARLVTDVIPLSGERSEFKLMFDVESIDPARGHYIYLILWADANGNGSYDPGEEWKYVIPLYDDPVFGGATDCVYYFDEQADARKGTLRGWNQSAGLEQYVPVDLACHDGARLANETAWTGRVV